MLQVFCVDVAKVDQDVSMLRMLIPQHNILIPDVAIICFRMLRMLQLFVFECCECCNYFLTYFRCCGC
jgi:hypothetical protein